MRSPSLSLTFPPFLTYIFFHFSPRRAALTQLIAGSDTTSNSSCAILYYIVSNPSAHKKLQKELDSTFGPRGVSGVLDYDDVKDPELPYLSACIREALRLHSTSAMGLPRLMTRETEVCGEVFPAGTILSVPSYSIHRLQEVFGEDAEEFRPERWLESEEKTKELEKALNIFSYGPVRPLSFPSLPLSLPSSLPLSLPSLLSHFRSLH